MKHPRSLKSELIYDLSLLTFCALILSSGLLLILIRISIPDELAKYTEVHLQHLHEAFVSGINISDSTEEQIEDRFKSYKLKDNNALVDIQLSVGRGELTDPILKIDNRSVLGLFKSSQEMRWSIPAGERYVFSYRADLRPLHLLLDKYKFIVFFMSLLVAALLVWVGYHLLFKRNVLIPIQNLSLTANAFREGDFSKRYELIRRDELGQIGEALNEMARRILEKEKKLVLTIESLQQANEEIEMKKNEQLQIEKLASVGRLAAGVAHEVGNPLGAISGYVDILRRSMQKASEVNKEDIDLLDRIESETNRISKIIRALLQQARPPQDRIRPVKLEPVLKKTVELAQIPPSIKVEFEFEDAEAEALCEKDQFLQVILNLVINAKHAIESKKNEESGLIKIRCVSRKLPNYHVSDDKDEPSLDTSVVRALKPQTYWMVSVTDNGVGISQEDRKKLFEPFFSTKETGKGTGLGLYVAKSIVESFRGAIVVQSEPGFGTSFSIFLPKDI